MKYFFVLFIIFFSILLFMPYFNPFEMQTGILFEIHYHFLSYLLGLGVILFALRLKFFNLNQFSDEDPLTNYFEKFFFTLFIPAILSIPICTAANQFLDSSATTVVTGRVLDFEYMSTKKLKTRKCKVTVSTEDNNYIAYYRPASIPCDETIIDQELVLSMKKGFLSKNWLNELQLVKEEKI